MFRFKHFYAAALISILTWLVIGVSAPVWSAQFIDKLETDDLVYTDTYWTDLRVPLSQSKLGSNLKPDFDQTNVALLFPQNDTAEVIYFITQMPHEWKQQTDIGLHVHWLQEAATAVNWVADIKVIQPNEASPGSFTTYNSATGSFSYTSGTLHQITDLGDVDMSAVDGVSAIILGKLWRDDNLTTGDVKAWAIDFHYQVDNPGSTQEYTK